MTVGKRVVLDANILLRAVFGVRVRALLEAYEDTVAFYSPDICFEDARRYIPGFAARRSADLAASDLVLDQIARIAQPVERALYEEFEKAARARIRSRDADDWPIVATSLLLDCPVWTKTTTSSEAASQPGPPTTSNSISATPEQPRPKGATACPQFSEGRSTWSITCAFVDSGFNPSCFAIAHLCDATTLSKIACQAPSRRFRAYPIVRQALPREKYLACLPSPKA
jgi:predicted nucleic acid-binding protein